jgi:hypothetical protein
MIKEGLVAGGATLKTSYKRVNMGGNWWDNCFMMGYDSSPASTQPDYCFTLARATTDANSVALNNTASEYLQIYLFEVKQ